MSPVAVAIAVWVAVGADGFSVEEAGRAADRVDRRIAQMQVDLRRTEESVGVGLAHQPSTFERRLADADVQLLLEDYWRAAVLLLDAVESPANRNHPRYDEAVYKLALALRLSRNFGSAHRYYQQILYRVEGERLTDVVEGLLDIATKTSNFEGVEQYIARLREAGGLDRPDVDYLHGKTLYQLGRNEPQRLQAALQLFRRIPPNAEVAPRAAYFSGVTLVRMNNYPEAITEFRRTLELLADRPEEEQLRDLTFLSLGRLHQEVGQVGSSIEAYAEIPESSPHFSQMLFERSWTFVKMANQAEFEKDQRTFLEQALVSTELLMATAPEPRLFAQARLLQGNLQIRLGASETAYDTFESVIDRYGTSKRELAQFVRNQEDTQAFFDQIIEARLDGLDPARVGLPELAVDFVLEEESTQRLLSVERDIIETQADLEESREIIDVLTETLEGDGRYRMFRGLEASHDRAVGIYNRWLTTELDLLEFERAAVEPYIGSVASETDRIHEDVLAIAQKIRSLPTDLDGVREQRSDVEVAYQEANLQAYKLTYRVSAMRSELQAVRSWLNQNRSTLSPVETEVVEDRIERTKERVAQLEMRLEALLKEIRTTAVAASANLASSRSRSLAARFLEARDQELALLGRGRVTAPNEVLGLLSRYDQQRRTLATIRLELERLEARIRTRVEDRVTEVRQQLARESARVDEAGDRFREVRTTTQRVLGPVSERTLAAVQDRFDGLVLEADVGVIDVAWARKQAETEKVTELVQELQERTQALEAEFADVLEE
ncbi:MAG: tetratricopeptide repeat protein [Myxococcota bacterium]